MTSQTPHPKDRAAAEQLVDEWLAGTSETYRWLHRDKAISNEIRFQKFLREERESKACRAVAACAREIADIINQAERHRVLGAEPQRRVA